MTEQLLRSAGSLAETFETTDWAATPLGPMDAWSDTLRNTVELMLDSRFPVTLFWGPERVLVYNEAYVGLIGDKHPQALGAPAREVFPEAWDIIGPLIDHVERTGEASWNEDSLVPLERHGFLEECYFTFSYSPVRGPDGGIEGVADIAVETTSPVISRRRLALVSEVGQALVDVESLAELPDRFHDVVGPGDDLLAVDLRLPGLPEPVLGTTLPARPTEPIGARDLVIEERDGRRVAWLPLRSHVEKDDQGGEVPAPWDEALLVVELSPRLPADRDYRLFLRLVADTLDHALGRIALLESERRMVARERGLSAALQRTLLTQPMAPDHLRVAVRYEPAADIAQIGGDWHDSFLLPSGSLALTIGDVAGHDREAAAAMGQARNLLRGIFFARPEDAPSEVLSTLDTTMQALGVSSIATAILARVEQTEEEAAAGLRRLRWSNAGHPPPVLVEPDGRARLLEAKPERLLGLPSSATRSDHEAVLRPGSHVVFYTDGLIERRGAPIDEGLAWLVERLSGTHGRTPDEVCDHLLSAMPADVGDDIALLVLHALPED